jgi:hypothetical protein
MSPLPKMPVLQPENTAAAQMIATNKNFLFNIERSPMETRKYLNRLKFISKQQA